MRPRREGEIFVDHRASPGLPEHVALAAGYVPDQVQEGKVFEAATLKCAHCQGVSIKNPMRLRAREYCPKCEYRYVCDLCYSKTQHPDYVHMSYLKKAELELENAIRGFIGPSLVLI